MRSTKSLMLFLVLLLLGHVHRPVISAEQEQGSADDEAQKQADINAFMKAAHGGKLAEVKAFLKKGIDLNAQGRLRLTALHWAILSNGARGDKPIIKFLVNQGIDLNLTARGEATPLHYAARYGQPDTVSFLVAHGADVDAKDDSGDTPLHDAAWRHDDVGVIEPLLAKSADVNIKNSEGCIPLQLAAKCGRKALVKVLLPHTSDVSVRDNDGLTVLHYAVMAGVKDMVSDFIAAGVDVNAKDDVGRTPLHYAIRRSDTKLRELLIAEGADTSISSMQPGKRVELEGSEDIGSLQLPLECSVGNNGDRAAKTIDVVFNLKGSTPVLYPAPEEQSYLHIENLEPVTRYGEPQVPMKTLVVKLPHNSKVTRVEVLEGRIAKVKGDYALVPARRGHGQRKNERLFYPDKSVYEKEAYYPGQWVRHEGGKDNANNYAFLRFYPVQYLPTEGRLVIATEAKLRLHYMDESSSLEESKTKHTPPVITSQSVVLAPEDLMEAAEKLRLFHEKDENISTAVVTLESIDANYLPAEEVPFEGYSNRDLKGRENVVNYDYELARKVVSYLRDTKSHPQLEFVTILGDAGLVPASYIHLLIFHDNPEKNKMRRWGATDLFYASPDYDFVPNYKVGRLPVNNLEEALQMVEKVKTWHEHAESDWFNHIAFHGGGHLYMQRAHNWTLLACDSNLMKPLLVGMQTTRSLQSEGQFKHDRLVRVLQEGNVGFLMLRVHGTETYVTSDGGKGVLTSGHLLKYSAEPRVPIVLSYACFAGEWARDNQKGHVDAGRNDAPSFAEALLKSKAGGIAYFGGESYGMLGVPLYYDQGRVVLAKYSFLLEMDYYILKSYHEGAGTLGELAYDSVFNFVANNEMDWWRNTVSLFMRTSLCDPALRIPQKHK